MTPMKKIIPVLLTLVIALSAAALSAQGTKILTNHVGYEASGPKLAVIHGHPGDAFSRFAVLDLGTGEKALEGVPVHAGPVRKWKDWDFWTVDWSAVTREGTYVIETVSVKGAARSHPVSVQKNVLERNTLSDVIYYFKGQRSSGPWDKADRAMTFEGRPGTVDVHGGWFDATGDYGKHLSHLSFSTFFNPQQISLTAWLLFRSLNELEVRHEPAFKQYQKRLLDEALFGADYLVRIKEPNGSFYISVSARGPEKKPEDRRISAKAGRHIILTPETKDKIRDYGREEIAGDAAYEAGYREGAGLCIAALAEAAIRGNAEERGDAVSSRERGEGEFKAADYLKAAEDAFSFLEKNNLRFTNDGKENIVDDYCALIAASALYRTTRKAGYKEAADRRAASLVSRLTSWSTGPGQPSYQNYWRADDGDRPFFHPVDAGLPVISLCEYLSTSPEAAMTEKVWDAISKSLTFELAVTDEVVNPFGYSRQLVQSKGGARRTSFFFPHDTDTAPWWQGENARLGSMAAAARLGALMLGESKDGAERALADRLWAFSSNQLNWILGLNPFDACMLHGKGRNNLAYMFFDSYEYTNAPGGICNGVTAGYADETGIDFGLHYAETGKDDDWRWAEQWLPHAAWYLYAVCLGGR
jgi:hypothetical protein